LVKICLSDGGDARSGDAEAGGIRAKLDGLDEVMMESQSPDKRTDNGPEG
jgi:hypothetical protein